MMLRGCPSFLLSFLLHPVFSANIGSNLAVYNIGNRKFLTAITSKGGSSSSRTFEKMKVEEFVGTKIKKIKTDGSCAILCLKEGLKTCDSFVIWDDIGTLTCTLGLGVGTSGNVEIYAVPLENRPTTTTTTTTTTITTTTTEICMYSYLLYNMKILSIQC